MRALRKIIRNFGQIKPGRNIIVPQPFTKQAFQDYQLINSKNYSFLMKMNPHENINQIYEHYADSPSNILKKQAIHIFPKNVPQLSIQQKYSAFQKKLLQRYQKVFQKCKTPQQLFHTERRVKSDIKKSCKFIGQITDRYKHYNLFQSLDEIKAKKTQSEYQKKGIKVNLLPFHNQDKKFIYPKGSIWLPTNQDYLHLFSDFLSQSNHLSKISKGNFLDIGCGSGILSFILGYKVKSNKDIKIFAIDKNKKAVQTCQVNASAFGLTNINSFYHDINKRSQLQVNFGQNKAPLKYELIVCNPPWIQAKRMKNQSEILDGVYDDKGKFLNSVLSLSGQLLAGKNSRLILIYSDLSQILGLQKKSIQELCSENNLKIYEKIEKPYSKIFNKHSVLNPFKAKANLQLFQIGFI